MLCVSYEYSPTQGTKFTALQLRNHFRFVLFRYSLVFFIPILQWIGCIVRILTRKLDTEAFHTTIRQEVLYCMIAMIMLEINNLPSTFHTISILTTKYIQSTMESSVHIIQRAVNLNTKELDTLLRTIYHIIIPPIRSIKDHYNLDKVTIWLLASLQDLTNTNKQAIKLNIPVILYPCLTYRLSPNFPTIPFCPIRFIK